MCQKNQIHAANAMKDTQLSAKIPYGAPIMPLADANLLEKFADLYNHSSETTKINGIESLVVNLDKGYLSSGIPTKPGFRAFLLYFVDINNDGQAEWVLVYKCEGSLCTSGIERVYKNKDHGLEILHFDELIVANFHLGDMSRWFLYIDNPFFTWKEGKIICNFYNGISPQVCSYLWQNNQFTLVHGSKNYCIHN